METSSPISPIGFGIDNNQIDFEINSVGLSIPQGKYHVERSADLIAAGNYALVYKLKKQDPTTQAWKDSGFVIKLCEELPPFVLNTELEHKILQSLHKATVIPYLNERKRTVNAIVMPNLGSKLGEINEDGSTTKNPILTTLPFQSLIKAAQVVTGYIRDFCENGVLHRDLKPENILIKQAEDGLELNIVDFGCAVAANKNGEFIMSPYAAEGTPGFIPPEIKDIRSKKNKSNVVKSLNRLGEKTEVSTLALIWAFLFNAKFSELKDYENSYGRIDFDLFQEPISDFPEIKGLPDVITAFMRKMYAVKPEDRPCLDQCLNFLDLLIALCENPTPENLDKLELLVQEPTRTSAITINPRFSDYAYKPALSIEISSPEAVERLRKQKEEEKQLEEEKQKIRDSLNSSSDTRASTALILLLEAEFQKELSSLASWEKWKSKNVPWLFVSSENSQSSSAPVVPPSAPAVMPSVTEPKQSSIGSTSWFFRIFDSKTPTVSDYSRRNYSFRW